MTASAALIDRVRGLTLEAAEAFAGTRQGAALTAAATDLDGPLRVAIVGMTNAGKSTLLNALIGERLAATDAAECTRVPTWYADGISSLAWAHPYDGEPTQLPFVRVDGATRLDLGRFEPGELDRITVQTPNRQLHGLTYVDTPGMGSLSAEHAARTTDLLTSTSATAGVDAVLYLMRHLHASDVNFLEAFRGQGAPDVRPISAIGVLSRADEIGSGRFDALDIAQDVAAAYRGDRRLTSLVQTVVPVAGLLAETAATLREVEYRGLTSIAAGAMADSQRALTSVDRFLSSERPLVDQAHRLLARFGLFGIRLSVELIRHEVITTADGLAQHLLDTSGIPALRGLLRSRFFERGATLKAQAALHVLDVALSERIVPAAERLQGRLEEIVATTHDIVEVRLLNELMTGDVVLDDNTAERLRRLLGHDGTQAHERLGLERPASGDTEPPIRAAIVEELQHWRRLVRSPLAAPTERRASRIAVRTCEHMLAQR